MRGQGGAGVRWIPRHRRSTDRANRRVSGDFCGKVPPTPPENELYSMLFSDSTMLIFFILKYIIKLTIIEKASVRIKA